MTEKKAVVCTVVGFLGLVSAATGFAAEVTRIKASQVRFPLPTECVYPRSPAMALGSTAAVTLMIARIIMTVSTGRIGGNISAHPSKSTHTGARFFSVFSWITFVIAFILLLAATALSNKHGGESDYSGNYSCYVVKPGVFAGGAVLSLASLILGITYYLKLTSAKSDEIPSGNPSAPNEGGRGGIAMGQPQFPPN